MGRQYNGRLGKEDNCQVGVFLVGVTPGGSALLDHQLYLPEGWCEDDQGVPATAARRSTSPSRSPSGPSPQIAAGLIRQTVALGVVALDWITADEEYGQNGEFLDELELLGLRYVVEVPVNTTVWTEDPASCVPPYGGRGRVPTRPSRESVASVAAVASSLGARVVAGPESGPGGERAARLRVRRGPGLGGASRRGRPAGLAAGAAVVGADARGQVLRQQRRRIDAAGGAGARWPARGTRSRTIFEDAKSYLGMAQYETRSWVGWHHHMSLVAMAHLFVTLTRRDLGKKRRS